MIACALLTVAVNVMLFAQMVAAKGLVAPSMLMVLLQISLGTVAAASADDGVHIEGESRARCGKRR